MKTILIVDDHAVVRQGLIRILAEAAERLAAEEAGTAQRSAWI